MVWLPCAVHVWRASLQYAVYPPEKEFACVSAKYLKSINYLVNPDWTKYFKVKSLNTLSCVVSGRSCGQSLTPDLRLAPVWIWYFSTVYVFLLSSFSGKQRFPFMQCEEGACDRICSTADSGAAHSQPRSCRSAAYGGRARHVKLNFRFFHGESAGRLFGTH